ncbi:anthranilate synthase component I [Fictibacillus sp. Mic-4]|uniref:anthranilate synthase component I n=1 Tax=Fictibacillus sp. Mic-4 TaxID=3132826 RepID=UPI003CEBC9CC
MSSILSHLVLNSEEKLVYVTEENIEITRTTKRLDKAGATDIILREIDFRKGALFSSSYEYPGRYSRWDIGFINPPLEIRATGRQFQIIALNSRGELLIPSIFEKLQTIASISVTKDGFAISGTIETSGEIFNEESRTLQPSIFTALRAIKERFASTKDSFLGLYGAFGYDLVFQFESLQYKHKRNSQKHDLVLYLPDELIIVDHQLSCAYQLSYEFKFGKDSTEGLLRDGVYVEQKGSIKPSIGLTYQSGKYANLVREALDEFRKGNLFEVVPSQILYEQYDATPSQVFNELTELNPSPYGFIINLGNEHLVGSSPEMYVRVEGNRVETCPISGTTKRGNNPIEDADYIRNLLNSYKDEAELTMCTDVDRNDKSRICVPGSVKVIGRRQIEMYSHLIHTVDHVEGYLSPQYDALDAFMTHMWAVTITGAPKRAAICWIEDHECSPREWYGGAVGYYNFNGDLNTGLTLRTIKMKDGMAEIRVGATLLYDSIPEAEEEETLTKAAALIKAIRAPKTKPSESAQETKHPGQGKRILLIDHEDSFVHTLGNYLKQTGAEVLTLRAPRAREVLNSSQTFDLVVISPGPGRPGDFHMNETIHLCLSRQLPIFGVCLGLQGIVEYFGGELGLLTEPQHGKSSNVKVKHDSLLWKGLPESFAVSRYHSLYAKQLPESMRVTAMSDDNVIMAAEHKHLPIVAVQFHPESILTSRDNVGMRIIENVVTYYCIREKVLSL